MAWLTPWSWGTVGCSSARPCSRPGRRRARRAAAPRGTRPLGFAVVGLVPHGPGRGRQRRPRRRARDRVRRGRPGGGHPTRPVEQPWPRGRGRQSSPGWRWRPSSTRPSSWPPSVPLRRNVVRVVGASVAAVATVAVVYLPHWLAAGSLVVGYLPGYLLEESGPNRAGILALVLPDAAVTPASVLVLAAVAAMVAWQWRSRTPTSRRRDLAVRCPAPRHDAELPVVRPAPHRVRCPR